MNKARRILTGGWLGNALSILTRGRFGGGYDSVGRVCVSAASLLPQPSAVGLMPAPAGVSLLPLPGAVGLMPAPTAMAILPQPDAAVVECS